MRSAIAIVSRRGLASALLALAVGSFPAATALAQDFQDPGLSVDLGASGIRFVNPAEPNFSLTDPGAARLIRGYYDAAQGAFTLGLRKHASTQNQANSSGLAMVCIPSSRPPQADAQQYLRLEAHKAWPTPSGAPVIAARIPLGGLGGVHYDLSDPELPPLAVLGVTTDANAAATCYWVNGVRAYSPSDDLGDPLCGPILGNEHPEPRVGVEQHESQFAGDLLYTGTFETPNVHMNVIRYQVQHRNGVPYIQYMVDIQNRTGSKKPVRVAVREWFPATDNPYQRRLGAVRSQIYTLRCDANGNATCEGDARSKDWMAEAGDLPPNEPIILSLEDAWLNGGDENQNGSNGGCLRLRGERRYTYHPGSPGFGHGFGVTAFDQVPGDEAVRWIGIPNLPSQP